MGDVDANDDGRGDHQRRITDPFILFSLASGCRNGCAGVTDERLNVRSVGLVRCCAFLVALCIKR